MPDGDSGSLSTNYSAYLDTPDFTDPTKSLSFSESDIPSTTFAPTLADAFDTTAPTFAPPGSFSLNSTSPVPIIPAGSTLSTASLDPSLANVIPTTVTTKPPVIVAPQTPAPRTDGSTTSSPRPSVIPPTFQPSDNSPVIPPEEYVAQITDPNQNLDVNSLLDLLTSKDPTGPLVPSRYDTGITEKGPTGVTIPNIFDAANKVGGPTTYNELDARFNAFNNASKGAEIAFAVKQNIESNQSATTHEINDATTVYTTNQARATGASVNLSSLKNQILTALQSRK